MLYGMLECVRANVCVGVHAFMRRSKVFGSVRE